MAVATRDAAFDFRELFVGESSGTVLLEEQAAVGAGTDLLLSPVTAELGAAGDHQGRDVGAGGAHKLSGCSLVAAGEEHDAVDRVGGDAFLDIHRHQVAEEHRRGLHEEFPERDGRELERHTAGGPDAALDRFGHPPQMYVAVRQFTPGITDADDGFVFEADGTQALRTQGRAADESFILGPAEPAGAAKFLGIAHADYDNKLPAKAD